MSTRSQKTCQILSEDLVINLPSVTEEDSMRVFDVGALVHSRYDGATLWKEIPVEENPAPEEREKRVQCTLTENHVMLVLCRCEDNHYFIYESQEQHFGFVWCGWLEVLAGVK